MWLADDTRLIENDIAASPLVIYGSDESTGSISYYDGITIIIKNRNLPV